MSSPAANSRESPTTKRDGEENREEENKYYGLGFTGLIVLTQCAYLLLIGFLCTYGPEASPRSAPSPSADGALLSLRSTFANIHVFLFIGLGFYLSRQRHWGYSSVGFTFLCSALAIQWALLVNGFWACVASGTWRAVPLDIAALVRADQAAFALMVSLAASAGALSSMQMVVAMWVHVVFYSLNKMIIEQKLEVVDTGGSMGVHAFGAVFGLVMARVAVRRETRECAAAEAKEYRSDLFGMLGTLFLWIFFVGFNSATAPYGPSQQRAVINTVMALVGACVTSFAFSQWLRPAHLFSLQDVSNASIAGGVAIGSSAIMAVYVSGALTIGAASGAIVVACELWVLPALRRLKYFSLVDVPGVLSAFAIPGFLGGVAATIAARCADLAQYGSELRVVFPAVAHGHNVENQAWRELAGLGVSVGFALIGGLATGLLLLVPQLSPDHSYPFQDKQHWDVKPTRDNAPDDDALLHAD